MMDVQISKSSMPPMISLAAVAENVPQPLVFGGRDLKLIFRDEFDEGKALAPHWSRTFFWGGRTLPTNKEEQVYTDAKFLQQKGIDLPDSAAVNDGALTLRADRVSDADRSKLGAAYASALVTTYQSFVFRYGIVEIRAKAPKGKGFWSALWLLRKDKGSRGEIDIMEVLGDRPDFLNVTLHMADDIRTNINRFVRKKTVDLTADYQIYSLLWNEKEIAFALNGTELARTQTPDALKAEMYLLINLAVGGKWAGPPNAATEFPGEFKIDYVRVWQDAVDKRPE